MKRSPLIKRRSEVINCFLFLFFALSGYASYFFRDAPPQRSLWIGLAFSVILALYLYLLSQRRASER